MKDHCIFKMYGTVGSCDIHFNIFSSSVLLDVT